MSPVKHISYLLLALVLLAGASLFLGGCAQIGAPTGGQRDSLPPVLVRSTPTLKATQVTGNKITLIFNEYVDLKEPQSSLLVSPTQKNVPYISSNLKTVTIRLKDSLLPNTTYLLKLGDAIRDVNEGNPASDFQFVFSTGDHIDTLSLSGKVLMAETGKADSTLMVILYRDAPDSAVQTRKPDFITRVNREGAFRFDYLPSANVKVYALKDGDGSKSYNSATEIFAFSDSSFQTNQNPNNITLFAFAKEKAKPVSNTPTNRTTPDKKLKYTAAFINGEQDILSDLHLDFNFKIKSFDSNLVSLTDTNFKKLPTKAVYIDSTKKKLVLQSTWEAGSDYVLLISPQAFLDTLGNSYANSDTLRFRAKKKTDYGRVALRFSNLNLSRNPMIQFIQGDKIMISAALTSTEWKNELILPGEYDLRIVYDLNRNGRWDPGDYSERRQPEISIALEKPIAIKADWDNEREIVL